MKADVSNLAQAISVGSLTVGETALQLLRYGAGEFRMTGALRTDGILRGLGGILPAAFTTVDRDAIPNGVGRKPFGMAILNPTTNRWEWNKGTDFAAVWASLGGADSGLYSALPAANSGNAGTFYIATDVKAVFFSDGSNWILVGQDIPRVTTLAGLVAFNSRIVELVDSVANPSYVYRLRYNSQRTTEGGAYKWEWAGGQFCKYDLPQFLAPHSSLGARVASAVAFTIPRTGVWRIRANVRCAIGDFQGLSGQNSDANPRILVGGVEFAGGFVTLGSGGTGWSFFNENLVMSNEGIISAGADVQLDVGAGGYNGFWVTPVEIEIEPVRIA